MLSREGGTAEQHNSLYTLRATNVLVVYQR